MLCICPHCSQSFNLEVPTKDSRRKTDLADYIITSVQDYFRVTPKQLTGHRRLKNYVQARHVCSFLLYKYCQLSLPATARMLGGRHHTTALHAIQRCYASYATGQDLYEHLKILSLEIEEIIEPKKPALKIA